MQTLPLYTIFAVWRDKLANDQAITDWCVAHYGKAHKVFAGLDPAQAPQPVDAPYILLDPEAKSEGVNEPHRYSLWVGWCIANPNHSTTGNITEMAGTKEVDELGQLILACLAEASPNYPITSVEYDIDGSVKFPQFIGAMALETEIDPAIGEEISYP